LPREDARERTENGPPPGPPGPALEDGPRRAAFPRLNTPGGDGDIDANWTLPPLVLLVVLWNCWLRSRVLSWPWCLFAAPPRDECNGVFEAN
jgi:hypothetical protein